MRRSCPLEGRITAARGLFCLLLLVLALSGCGGAVQSAQPLARRTPLDTGATPLALTPTALPTSTVVSAALPRRLIIHALGINASIEPVSILPTGNLATPTRNPWEDAGWYTGGPRPGGPGSAVIDGHLDRPGGRPAIFWSLRRMQVGNEVLVSGSNGKTLHFRVTRVVFYEPQNAPIQEIFGNSSGTFLNLITCAGDWIPSQHQTTLRLVVFTSLVA